MIGLASEAVVAAGWVAIALYCAIILFFVVRGARRTKTIADYAVGSMAFSPSIVALSLAASMMSAATFIINPGLIANYGISGVIGYAIVLPVAAIGSLIVLTKGFRRQGQVVKAQTLAQWIGARWRSPRFAVFFALLALLLITFIVLICVGLTKVLSKTLNVDELYVLIGVVTFIFGYMMFGGANSMVYTNAVQAGLMLVVSFVLLGSGYEHFSDGVHGFLAKLQAIDPMLVEPTNPGSYLFRDYFEIVFCTIIVGVAVVCQPHILTKSLLLRSDRDVNRYLLVASIVSGIFFLVVIAGLYARIAFPDLTVGGTALKSDGVISAYVVQEFPVYLAIVVVLGLVAAGISTLEGLIQSVATTITVDLLRPLAHKVLPRVGRAYPEDEAPRARVELRINRAVIVILAVVSAVIAYDQIRNPQLSVAILAQNGVFGYFAAAFVPVLFGTFFAKTPPIAAMLASITAVVVHFSIYYGELISYMRAPVKNPGIPAALAIVASLAVSLATLLVVRAIQRRPGAAARGTTRRQRPITSGAAE